MAAYDENRKYDDESSVDIPYPSDGEADDSVLILRLQR